MDYGLNDITLIPARTTRVKSRSECNPYNADEMLPLFASPMNCIVDEKNYTQFIENKINTIIPRGVDYETRYKLSNRTFIALGLKDEFNRFCNDFENDLGNEDTIRYICIDVANGHMQDLINKCAEAKKKFGYKLIIMAGNVANPDTYTDYAIAGIDFIRISIGSGGGCLTACNTGIYMPMASLIKRMVDKKWEIEQCIKASQHLRSNLSGFSIGGVPKLDCPYKSIPFIVADGGFDNYDKIIKALALGADFVMIGKLFAQCEEACGEVALKEVSKTFIEHIPIDQHNIQKRYYLKNVDILHRIYYGMSTKKAQLENGNDKLKTSEGVERLVPIEYNLKGWTENFIDYLRSAMSYSDSFDLNEFKNTEYHIIPSTEYLTFYKSKNI